MRSFSSSGAQSAHPSVGPEMKKHCRKRDKMLPHWIFLIFIGITMFCNVASIILYSIVDKFVNPVKYKNQIISYLKMGFVSALSFTLLALLPNIMLWFYML